MASSRRQMWIFFNLALFAMSTISCAAQAVCPNDSEDLVYPYWSLCDRPAVYREPFYLVSANQTEGGLIAEWDQSNLTYYVRLTGSDADLGDAITLLPFHTHNSGTVVRLSHAVLVATSMSRFWHWKKEGEMEWFLEDRQCDSIEGCNAAHFNLVDADIPLMCPRMAGIRCQAYYLTSSGGGLVRYVEDGVTYIKLGDKGSNGDMPLLLIKKSSIQVA